MQELNIYALAGGKQTARGTALATPTKRLIQVAGDLKPGQDRGSENFSDLNKYGDSSDWINSVVGNGTPGIEATPEELAYLLWLFHGAETVTSITGPPAKKKHTFIPGNAFFWSTFWRRVGRTQVDRHKFIDCRISQMVIEGSTANKAVRATPTILSLDPAQNLAADPTWPAMPTKAPFLYTDGTGTFTLDGVVHSGHSQFTLTINEDLSPIYADDVLALDVVPGNPTVTIGATVFLDANGYAAWNKQIYGTATPADLAKPIKSLPALGSYSFYLKARDNAGALNGDEFKLTIPGVQWQVPEKPDPNPDGGNAEIALAGASRIVGVQDAYTIDVNNDDIAYTT